MLDLGLHLVRRRRVHAPQERLERVDPGPRRQARLHAASDLRAEMFFFGHGCLVLGLCCIDAVRQPSLFPGLSSSH